MESELFGMESKLYLNIYKSIHIYTHNTSARKVYPRYLSNNLADIKISNFRCFYSRLGNPFYAPKWFTKDLPTDMHLDGELFGGRKMFQSTVSIVKTPECDQWKKIKYHVFDAPSLQKEPFEKRMKAIRDYFDEVRWVNINFISWLSL